MCELYKYDALYGPIFREASHLSAISTYISRVCQISALANDGTMLALLQRVFY